MDCLPSASSVLLPITSKNDAADENDNDTITTSNKSKTRKISSVVGSVLVASLSKLSPRRSPKRKSHVPNQMARRQLCEISQEYAISSKTPVIRQALKQRVQCMPFAPYQGGSPMGNLPPQCIRANMIIEMASQTPANTMAYCITFLGSNASPMNGYHHLWISDDALDTCINIQTVKVKYIYDQTIVRKDGWLGRSQHSSQSHLGGVQGDFGIGWISGGNGEETNIDEKSRKSNEDGDSSGEEIDLNEYYDSSSNDDDLLTLKKLREDYEAREGKIEEI